MINLKFKENEIYIVHPSWKCKFINLYELQENHNKLCLMFLNQRKISNFDNNIISYYFYVIDINKKIKIMSFELQYNKFESLT